MANGHSLYNQAIMYHEEMPSRIHEYLNRRGIIDEIIQLHLLGWNGKRITIPVWGREPHQAFFRLAKDPEDRSGSPKILSPSGAPVELYGWERVRAKPQRIVICEGEFDRLVLESQGLAAVTSTGGAGIFQKEWAKDFEAIPEVYVCFDRDEAGRQGAERVTGLLHQARLVDLPHEVGEGGDVTDFFVRLGYAREDFLRLLAKAQPAQQPGDTQALNQAAGRLKRRLDGDVECLKAAVAIKDVVQRYIVLRPCGSRLVGRCPFHEDHRPSFVVYPETQTFYCFGCQVRGDVIAFLMQAEQLTFKEVLKVLKKATF